MVKKELNIIIPCAGVGRRIKSCGPKCLLKIGSETVLSRQIKILNSIYKNTQITVVTGFQANKIKKTLSKDINEVYNENYEWTNVAYSIGLALNQLKCKTALIVYGDLVFNKNIFIHCENDDNIVISDNKYFSDDEVGINHTDSNINCFDYGLPLKWAHIAKINSKCVDQFIKILDDKTKHKWFSFEVFNELINKGIEFYEEGVKNLKIVDIDQFSDLNRANQLIN